MPASEEEIQAFKRTFKGFLADYKFMVDGLYLKNGDVLPLPSESAVVGKVVEITIKSHLTKKTWGRTDIRLLPGGPRSYPDLSVDGPALGGRQFAIDVKCVRRGRNKKSTESAMGLATYDATYFRKPDEKAPNIMAAYNTYDAHLVLVALYDYSDATAQNVQLALVEKWRIATRKRASGTRCYVAAVTEIDRLLAEKGDFSSEEEFNEYWRSVPIKEKAVRTRKQKAPKKPIGAQEAVLAPSAT